MGLSKLLPPLRLASKQTLGRLPNWLNAVVNKDYIERLKQINFHLHKADSEWVESVPVHEMFQGKTVWKGTVEVFNLRNHPKAKRAYGWSHKVESGNVSERFATVLEIPPADSPQKAVQVSVIHEMKGKK